MFNIRKAGAWSPLTAPKKRVAGAWAAVAAVKKRAGGVWVQVWPLVLITAQNVTRTGTVATLAQYRLNASGTVDKTEGGTTTVLETWLLAGVNSDYEVRATVSSGDTPSGSALGTWLALSSDRSWSLQDATADFVALTCNLLVEIRTVTSGVVETIDTITITSDKV